MVRAKFRVQQVQSTHYHGGTPQESIELVPASGKENEEWSKWTPSGHIKMTITNPAALEQLKLGQEFFVDFTPVPAPEEKK